uniref:AlNc14C138G7159 protein n=1 Tax=Albugo laibachii Nc14 TaxID=890382 RepID=F0WKW9_9STRA|nr:AlNc14C138G7159 [Albugo laibachii Nc14]CCA24778.1 AlNc14C258G9759 [Albugo laibachii Nc14]|eukprot:CCA24778.1 AlNc14C258G9759 [Albugo laibachii Nc14]
MEFQSDSLSNYASFFEAFILINISEFGKLQASLCSHSWDSESNANHAIELDLEVSPSIDIIQCVLQRTPDHAPPVCENKCVPLPKIISQAYALSLVSSVSYKCAIKSNSDHTHAILLDVAFRSNFHSCQEVAQFVTRVTAWATLFIQQPRSLP